MSTIAKELSRNLFEEYMDMSDEQSDMLIAHQQLEPTYEILNLISDYNTLKILLAEQEYKLQKELLEYDSQYLILKEQYLENGLKATEAKEHAKDDLVNKKEDILLIEKDISILKAGIHSTEYQLRLKYIQFKQEAYLDSDTLTRIDDLEVLVKNYLESPIK